MSNPIDWVYVQVPAGVETEAKRVHAEADERNQGRSRNWQARDGDEPWIGTAAELALDAWLTQQRIEHVHITDDDHKNPDFLIRGVATGLKCSKRATDPEPHYEIGVSGLVVPREPAIMFLFAIYQSQVRELIFPGGLWRYDFLNHARYFGPGKRVHANFVVPPESSVHNVYIRELIPLRQLLASTEKGIGKRNGG